VRRSHPLLAQPAAQGPRLRQGSYPPCRVRPCRAAHPARASARCRRSRGRPLRRCSPMRPPLRRPRPLRRLCPPLRVLHRGLPQRRATAPRPSRRLPQQQTQRAPNAPSARRAASPRSLLGPHPASQRTPGPRRSPARRAGPLRRPPRPPARVVRVRPQPTAPLPTAPATTCSTCSAIRNEVRAGGQRWRRRPRLAPALSAPSKTPLFVGPKPGWPKNLARPAGV
jgi:hypothetical protein